jgi:hypothetical protein
VYAHFTAEDEGRSREFICECSNPEDAAFIALAVNNLASLREALANFRAMEARDLPTPYGHDCQWCSACVHKAKREADSALWLSEEK